MKSKFLVILTLIFALCLCAVYADGVNVDNGINFVTDAGDIIRAFPDVTNSDYTMHASVTVKNESNLQKDMVLFVSVYDRNNNLKKLSYDIISAPVNGEDIGSVPVTIPRGTVESDFICKAYLWDTIAGKIAYRTESIFLDLNTNLYGITIGGVDIEDYSDDTDVYSVKVAKANSEIKVYPKSGATIVQYNEINVPGTSKIKLTDGENTRNITIKTYLEEKDKYTLSALKYKIGDTEYSVEGFDPDINEYTVNLPDNTFYVALLPEAMGEVTCTIQDINDSPNVINGVSFGKMRTDTTGPSYVYERKAVKGVVPIKNESTKAFVNVTDGEKTTEYTINFRAVQPRLTGFNLVGADGDHYVPVFTSGAGFNNDNGTICVSDRMWAAANISKKLIGASYFMSPYNNKGGGQWWNDVGAKGDEYFNFTADTAGTVYLLGNSNISEYSGWEKVNNGTVPTHPKGYTLGDKTWNDYDDTEFFMSCVKWNSDRGRCDECGVGTMQESQISYIDGCVQYKYAFAKHFEAGEQVSIKHTGEYGNSAAEIIWAVVWDVDVNYPVLPDTGDEETGDDDEPGSDEGDIKDISEYGESTYTGGYYVPGSSGSDYVTLTISGSQDEGSEHIQTAVLKSGVSSVPAGENAINVGGALGKIKLKNNDNYGAKTLHCKYTFVESSSPILMRFQYQTSTNDGSPKDTFTMTNEGVTFGDASVSATAPYEINIFQNVATGVTVIYVNDEILYDGRETGDNLWGSESDHWHQFRFRTVEEDSAFRLVVKNMHHEVYSEEVLLTEVINYVMAEEETGDDNPGEDPIDPPVTPDHPGDVEEDYTLDGYNKKQLDNNWANVNLENVQDPTTGVHTTTATYSGTLAAGKRIATFQPWEKGQGTREDAAGTYTMHFGFTVNEVTSPLALAYKYDAGGTKYLAVLTNSKVVAGSSLDGETYIGVTAPYTINCFMNIQSGDGYVYVNDQLLYQGGMTNSSGDKKWHEVRVTSLEETTSIKLVTTKANSSIFNESVTIQEVIDYIMNGVQFGDNGESGDDETDSNIPEGIQNISSYALNGYFYNQLNNNWAEVTLSDETDNATGVITTTATCSGTLAAGKRIASFQPWDKNKPTYSNAAGAYTMHFGFTVKELNSPLCLEYRFDASKKLISFSDSKVVWGDSMDGDTYIEVTEPYTIDIFMNIQDCRGIIYVNGQVLYDGTIEGASRFCNSGADTKWTEIRVKNLQGATDIKFVTTAANGSIYDDGITLQDVVKAYLGEDIFGEDPVVPPVEPEEPGDGEGDIKDVSEFGESTYTGGYYVPGSSGSDYVTLTITGNQDEGSEHIQTAVLKSGSGSVLAGENAINVGGALGNVKLKNNGSYGAKTLHCRYSFVESSSPILMRFQYQTSSNDGSPKDTFTMANTGVTFGDASVSATAPYDINIFQNVETGVTVIYVNDEVLYDGRIKGENLFGSGSHHWHQFRFRTTEEDSAFKLVIKNMHHEVYSEDVSLSEVIDYVMLNYATLDK